jgi:phage tail sheath protein FI
LLAHANQYSRIAILHGASNATVSGIKTFAQTIISNEENLEHGALYYPWVYAPTAVNGVNRLLPPDGFVAAKRSKVVNNSGAHIPAAGVASAASFVNGVVTDIDRTNGDSLDDQSVNAIRVIANTVRIYGARSLSQDTTNFRYITSQDVVNGIVTDAYAALEPLVFSPIDGRGAVFAGIEARLISVLESYRIGGALFEAFNSNGQRLDYGYTVKCDATLNPASQLAEGRIKAKVGVRVSSVGDKIDVEIVKSSLTASVT